MDSTNVKIQEIRQAPFKTHLLHNIMMEPYKFQIDNLAYRTVYLRQSERCFRFRGSDSDIHETERIY